MKMFMCLPTFYDVIHKNMNVHMQLRRPVDYIKACSQHLNLTRILLDNGANINFIKPQPELVDMVFAANGALIDHVSNTAIVSNFKADTRINESYYWKNFLRENNYNVVTTSAKFEGQGDALFSHNNKILWYGYGFRSEIIAAYQITDQCSHLTVQTLKLCDPRFYHLDTCFCVLDENTVMYYPGAFDEESEQKIKIAFTNIVKVSENDAQHFACNAVVLNKTIVLHCVSNPLKKELQNYGFTVVENNMSEFLLSGGSAKCCVMHR